MAAHSVCQLQCEYYYLTHLSIVTAPVSWDGHGSIVCVYVWTHRFHGHGTLYFPNGGKFEAEWEKGRTVGLCTGGQYTFSDGLQCEEMDWKYCDGIDRRFWTEVCQEIQPAGK